MWGKTNNGYINITTTIIISIIIITIITIITRTLSHAHSFTYSPGGSLRRELRL